MRIETALRDMGRFYEGRNLIELFHFAHRMDIRGDKSSVGEQDAALRHFNRIIAQASFFREISESRRLEIAPEVTLEEVETLANRITSASGLQIPWQSLEIISGRSTDPTLTTRFPALIGTEKSGYSFCQERVTIFLLDNLATESRQMRLLLSIVSQRPERYPGFSNARNLDPIQYCRNQVILHELLHTGHNEIDPGSYGFKEDIRAEKNAYLQRAKDMFEEHFGPNAEEVNLSDLPPEALETVQRSKQIIAGLLIQELLIHAYHEGFVNLIAGEIFHQDGYGPLFDVEHLTEPNTNYLSVLNQTVLERLHFSGPQGGQVLEALHVEVESSALQLIVKLRQRLGGDFRRIVGFFLEHPPGSLEELTDHQVYFSRYQLR